MSQVSQSNGRSLDRRSWMAPLLAVGLLLCLPWKSEAIVVLWDQSGYSTSSGAVVDQQFPDLPDFSTYMVSDVSVTGGQWSVSAVTVYLTKSRDWSSVNQGVLNVFPKTGPLPSDLTDNPGSGDVVSVSVTSTLAADAWAVRADGLALLLPPGEYWIGLTPIADFSTFLQEFHWPAAALGDPTVLRNPGGGFGIGNNWQQASVFLGGYGDAAILVEGDVVPEPGTLLLIGSGLTGLALRRRRRG